MRFLPGMRLLKEQLAGGRIGEVKLITVTFGGIVPPQYENRLRSPELAGGVTLDMGVYPISVACYLLGEIPTEIRSLANRSLTGVDETALYQFRFPSGVLVSIQTSYNLRTEKTAFIYGSRGYVRLPDFPAGECFTLHLHNGTNDVAEVIESGEKSERNGFLYQVSEVVHCIRAGKQESGIIPLDETVAILEVMDRMRGEWGLRYPFE